MRPFRFAAAIGSPRSRTDFIHEVQEIERVGYDAVVLSDHLLDQFGPISSLGLAAGVTSRLGLGTFVFNNDLRHPVVLAQELATLDRLSDGRLLIGIGAGWNDPEYESIGIPFDAGSVRIDRLAEAITILKGVFADGPLDFDGRFYTVKGLADLPRPLQRPHPPFLLGGGSPKLLRLAAREAQVVSIAPRVLADGTADVSGCTLAGNSRKIALIRDAAGDRFESIDINTYPSLGAKLTDSSRSAAAEVATRLRNRFHVDLSEEDVLDSPHVFIGSVDSLVQKFQRLRETLSINHIMVGEHWQDFVPIMERLRGT